MTQQIHQDMVHKCPADFELLAWSDLTPIQGICKLYPKDQVIPAFTHSHPRFLAEDPWKHVHIIAFQVRCRRCSRRSLDKWNTKLN